MTLKGFSQDIYRNKNFIVLFGDSTLHEYKEISLEKTSFKARHFLADSIKFSMKQVRLYQNETGFWANVKDVQYTSSPEFARCMVSGKINLFEINKNSHTSGFYDYNHEPFTDQQETRMHSHESSSRTIRQFYNVTTR